MLNVYIHYNSAIALLGIDPREIKTCIHKKEIYVNVYNSFIHN